MIDKTKSKTYHVINICVGYFFAAIFLLTLLIVNTPTQFDKTTEVIDVIQKVSKTTTSYTIRMTDKNYKIPTFISDKYEIVSSLKEGSKIVVFVYEEFIVQLEIDSQLIYSPEDFTKLAKTSNTIRKSVVILFSLGVFLLTGFIHIKLIKNNFYKVEYEKHKFIKSILNKDAKIISGEIDSRTQSLLDLVMKYNPDDFLEEELETDAYSFCVATFIMVYELMLSQGTLNHDSLKEELRKQMAELFIYEGKEEPEKVIESLEPMIDEAIEILMND